MALSGAFHRPLRLVSASLWLLGAALAGLTVPFMAWRVSVASSLGLALVAICLLLLARETIRRARWALLIGLIGCGGQVLGVIGSAWELIHPTDSAKSRELQTLGIDPTLAFTINLIYSAGASAIFFWAAARLIHISRASAKVEPTLRDRP